VDVCEGWIAREAESYQRPEAWIAVGIASRMKSTVQVNFVGGLVLEAEFDYQKVRRKIVPGIQVLQIRQVDVVML
jgi:hypothetical protein